VPNEKCHHQLEERILMLEQRLTHVFEDSAHLKAAMMQNTVALQEYIELAKTFKIGLKMLGWIERSAVWIAKIAAALGILISLWHYAIKEALEKTGK
jgi:hypothetical protein